MGFYYESSPKGNGDGDLYLPICSKIIIITEVLASSLDCAHVWQLYTRVWKWDAEPHVGGCNVRVTL